MFLKNMYRLPNTLEEIFSANIFDKATFQINGSNSDFELATDVQAKPEVYGGHLAVDLHLVVGDEREVDHAEAANDAATAKTI